MAEKGDGLTDSDDHGDRHLPLDLPENGDGDKQDAGTKRERLQKKLALEKVEESDHEIDEGLQGPKRYACPDYFGVRSYMHNFYESRFFKDPQKYEEDDYSYLLHPGGSKKRHCRSIWWKVFVWIGANLLVFGIIGILIGYLAPKRNIVVETSGSHEVIDNDAVYYNQNLDVCKITGLVLFCMGGLTLTISLLFPSFLYHYCEDDRRLDDESFKVHLGPGKVEPKSPLEMAIPSTSKLSNVQPDRKTNESIVTQEGLVSTDQ